MHIFSKINNLNSLKENLHIYNSIMCEPCVYGRKQLPFRETAQARANYKWRTNPKNIPRLKVLAARASKRYLAKKNHNMTIEEYDEYLAERTFMNCLSCLRIMFKDNYSF